MVKSNLWNVREDLIKVGIICPLGLNRVNLSAKKMWRRVSSIPFMLLQPVILVDMANDESDSKKKGSGKLKLFGLDAYFLDTWAPLSNTNVLDFKVKSLIKAI